MVNAAYCYGCQTIIESTHRHDFKYCPCEGVAVDGGQDYNRRVFRGDTGWYDFSSQDELDAARRGNLPVAE